MTEIWNCLRALLHGIQGQRRVDQARQAGVFDVHGVENGDNEAEELLLGMYMLQYHGLQILY